MASWREMSHRCEEEAPLVAAPRSGGRSGGPRKSQTSCADASIPPKEGFLDADESDILESGFTVRKFSASAIRYWLLFQVGALFFQLLLWREVSTHLASYEMAMQRECEAVDPSRKHRGICVGPSWNLAYYQDVVLPSLSNTQSYSWQFSTLSKPPTFLVSVDPVSKSQVDNADPPPAPGGPQELWQEPKDTSWRLEVTRVQPTHVGPAFSRQHSGQQAVTFEDFSHEAASVMAGGGRVDWRATLTSRASGYYHRKTRFLVAVEDARMSHLAEIHMSQQCAFGRSWKSFNEQHRGVNHRALSWCRFLVGVFILLGGASVYLVHREVTGAALLGGGAYAFHWIVVAKFFMQDVPQQVCVVLYFFGWYEASGLRCQLCLFESAYCGAEHPFHFANLVALTFTLLSACANQLLVRPVLKRTYTDDDICLQYSIRVGGVCVSVLPFTTTMCLASGSLLPLPALVHWFLAVPCVLGWLCLGGLMCVPMLICCDDDCV